jgi:membrane-associated phospholipid phosphatase
MIGRDTYLRSNKKGQAFKIDFLALVREGLPLLAVYLLYSLVRWVVASDDSGVALSNALKIVQLERHMGIFYEPIIQSNLIRHAGGVIQLANLFYSVGYLPILVILAVALYKRKRDRYHTFKLAFLMALGFALVGYSLYPLAPPRLMPEFGFVDAQQTYGSGLYSDPFFMTLYNPYAAMPSMHFCCALLVAITASGFGRRVIRVAGALYPCLMAVVIVMTGHHYLLDIVGGGIVASLAWRLTRVLRARKALAPRVVTQEGRAHKRLPRSAVPASTIRVDRGWTMQQEMSYIRSRHGYWGR